MAPCLLEEVQAGERAGQGVAARKRGERGQEPPRLAGGLARAAIGRRRRLRLQRGHAAREAHVTAHHWRDHAVPHLQRRIKQPCATRAADDLGAAASAR